MFIGKEMVDFQKEHIFNESGIYEVKFKLYSKFNMDYMFKDVSALTSVIMISNNDAHITSMISTFENCKNLYDLTINGFNTDELISMKRFLFNTNPLILLKLFSTKNVEDMSYMFSEMKEIRFINN